VISLHSLLGRHSADLKASRWDEGNFVTRCLMCGAGMVKPPGLEWQLQKVRS
jgi:hypothetical protein